MRSIYKKSLEERREQRNNAIRIRRRQVLNDPLAPYAEWVIMQVCEHQRITIEEIKSSCRITAFVEARFYAMKILDENTDFNDYVTVFVEKERTAFYNYMKKIRGFLLIPRNKRIFDELNKKCSLIEYKRLTGK